MLDSQIYSKAADIIQKGWVQNTFAKNGCGAGTHPCGDDAESWCLSGALIASIYLIEGDYLSSCPNRLTEGLMLGGDVIVWNDHPYRKKEHVVAVLRKAAARNLLLEGKEKR